MLDAPVVVRSNDGSRVTKCLLHMLPHCHEMVLNEVETLMRQLGSIEEAW